MNKLVVASFLSELRREGRLVPLPVAEVLLLVASGVDNTSDLRLAMGSGDRQKLPQQTLYRYISSMTGRSKFVDGRWEKAAFIPPLLETRKHPHRHGEILSLSETGKQLINNYFDDPST